MLYHEYIRSDKWRAIAAKVKENSGYKCQICNSPKSLVAHHRSYKNLGNEENFLGDLVCLCSQCHERFHQPKEVNGRMVVTRMPDNVTHAQPEQMNRPATAYDAKRLKKEAKLLRREANVIQARIELEKAKRRYADIAAKSVVPIEQIQAKPIGIRQSKRLAMIGTYSHDADMPEGDPIILTKILIDRLRTKGGAFTNASVKPLGVEWPLIKGWPSALIGKRVSREIYAQCLRGREMYANPVISTAVITCKIA